MTQKKNYKSTWSGTGLEQLAAPIDKLNRIKTVADAISKAANDITTATAATTNMSVAASLGDYSTVSTTGYKATAVSADDKAEAEALGVFAVAAATGDSATAVSSGCFGAAVSTGYYSAARGTGQYSVAVNSGHGSTAEAKGYSSVAVANGLEPRVRGAIGCAIVCTERYQDSNGLHPLRAVCAAIVDDDKIKANTWYTVKDGKFVEAQDDGD